MAIPLLLVAFGAALRLQAGVNTYDEGNLLTLARFTSFTRLPYRDLWTLYGPGPPVFGSLLTHVFGSDLTVTRLGYMLMGAAVVAAVYAIAVRFVPWWGAVVLSLPIATFASSPSHFHFAMTLAFLLWGIWFLLRLADQPDRRLRRSAIGSTLIGFAFLGRFEFAVFSVPLVIVVWWFLRPSLGSDSWWVLAAGLAPVALFAGYLVLVVGWDRAVYNLVEYAVRYYSKPYCRGLPPVWGAAADALVAPVAGRLWTGEELTLALGTFLAPVFGIGELVVAFRRGRRDVYGLALTLIGAVTLVMWLEMRARAGGEPHPTWPPMMVGAAMGLGWLRQRRPRAAVTALAAAGVLFGAVAAVSWLPDRAVAWTRFPPYQPPYGFARMETEFGFDRPTWAQVRATVQRYAPPGAPIFVALFQNSGHFANMPVFYWVADRPPVTRFFELHPCHTDREEIQRIIVDDLQDADVVITTAYYANPPPPLGPPATALDEELAASFEVVYEGSLEAEGDIRVLVRRGTSDATTTVMRRGRSRSGR